MGASAESLDQGADIIIATPGRLIALLAAGTVSWITCNTCVGRSRPHAGYGLL